MFGSRGTQNSRGRVGGNFTAHFPNFSLINTLFETLALFLLWAPHSFANFLFHPAYREIFPSPLAFLPCKYTFPLLFFQFSVAMSKFARLVNTLEALTAFKAKYHIPDDIALSIVIRIP